jgi:predicted metal-dependent phosphoesterase TrpH
MPPRFDLQSHSTHSDGALEAAEVVERAARAGVELLALTDHDTVTGVAEALRAGERHGVKVVPAVEISAIDAGGQEGGVGTSRELHILGYDIAHAGPELTTRLTEFLADREQRTLRMAAALRELDWELDERELEARQAAGRPIGRPHLAEAVLACPGNGARLERERIDDIGSLIKAYLIEGKPAFRLRETPTVAQAVEAIHDAGGVAVWAHPFWDITDPDEVLATIDRFKPLGIDGVEAFYITHTREQTVLLA